MRVLFKQEATAQAGSVFVRATILCMKITGYISTNVVADIHVHDSYEALPPNYFHINNLI